MIFELRLSATARADIVDLLTRTSEHFGEQARLRYEHLIVVALHDLAADPERIGSVDCGFRRSRPGIPINHRPPIPI